jgi:hypothetical protein
MEPGSPISLRRQGFAGIGAAGHAGVEQNRHPVGSLADAGQPMKARQPAIGLAPAMVGAVKPTHAIVFGPTHVEVDVELVSPYSGSVMGHPLYREPLPTGYILLRRSAWVLRQMTRLADVARHWWCDQHRRRVHRIGQR